ncbi:uncharacterized protein METZ01_LOCUS207547, partial [marine metagenome]
PEEIDAIFREGICVLAAHAFLKAHGEDGFVDGERGDANERIKRFSSIGAVVLKQYFEKR